jgi:hypothetical protein
LENPSQGSNRKVPISERNPSAEKKSNQESKSKKSKIYRENPSAEKKNPNPDWETQIRGERQKELD